MPDAQPAAAVAPASAPGARSRNAVLLLEDNEAIARLLATVLQRLSLHVIWCPTAREGLKEFDRQLGSIALIISDCGLPDGDGRVVCQQMRAKAGQLPILLTSGRARADNLTPMVEGRLVRFLPKPYAPSELLAQVRNLMAAAQPAPPAGFV